MIPVFVLLAVAVGVVYAGWASGDRTISMGAALSLSVGRDAFLYLWFSPDDGT